MAVGPAFVLAGGILIEAALAFVVLEGWAPQASIS
jgi:hypothetical protein